MVFFSFGKYAFFGFQIRTNHMIYTKVRSIFPTFGNNFSSHKPTPLEHYKTSKKPIIVGGLNPSSLKNHAQCSTSFMP
jgi:hypothetical protein